MKNGTALLADPDALRDWMLDQIAGDLVAQHMLGEPVPSVTPARLIALSEIRDHRGRIHNMNASQATQWLAGIARSRALPLVLIAGTAQYDLVAIAPLPVVCDVVNGKLVNVGPRPAAGGTNAG